MVYPLGVHSAESFLDQYWQRKPLLIRNAIPQFKSILSPDELAGLAMDAALESRLVLEQGAASPWEVRHGPFDASQFASLPARDWTLLVQAVDQFVPEVAKLRDSFSFLPSWRVDDVMISYAVPGGSVGPHFDHYDVFLLQGQGSRRWRLGGRCDSESGLLPQTELMILQDFTVQEEWVLEPGDMLYLPPGIAHWGTAVDECISYSIGFRAPSVAELLAGVAEQALVNMPPELRYRDSGLHPLDSAPGEIPLAVIENLRALLTGAIDDDGLLVKTFGQIMTERRYMIEPADEGGASGDIQRLLTTGHELIKDPGSRFAYTQATSEKGRATLFVDGESYNCSLSLARLMCGASFTTAQLKINDLNSTEIALIAQLIESGALQIEPTTD